MNDLAFIHVIRPLRLHSIRLENAVCKLKAKKTWLRQKGGKGVC